jgi:hypothetical protein
MTAPTWATTPDPYAIDIIADDVRAEFVDIGCPAKVEVGSWQRFKDDPSPRVIFGISDGEGRALDGTQRRGADFPVKGGTARAIWACDQRFNVWVTHPPTAGTPPDQRARQARALTWRLLQATLAAMAHSYGGMGFSWGSLVPLAEDQGVSTHGAALSFVARYNLPILDTPTPTGAVEAVGATETLSREDVDVDDAPPFEVP